MLLLLPRYRSALLSVYLEVVRCHVHVLPGRKIANRNMKGTILTFLELILALQCINVQTEFVLASSPHGDEPLAVRKLQDGEKFVERQTTILLFGALGDLAKKYLWRGFFNLYIGSYKESQNRDRIRIYGAGRTDEEKGRKTFAQIMEEASYCDKRNSECTEGLSSFEEISSYHRAKSADDYKALSDRISQEIAVKGVKEKLRIIYLSVPPFAYPQILALVHAYLRPENADTWVRIVFEKPFGHNRESSQALHSLVMKYFKEEEVYRVDHYLGKTTVEEITKFRQRNKEELSYIWNDNFIDSVEVVMKEKLDCKGRTEFYDKYGVLLDTIQNHLTEIFARLVMDLQSSSNYSDFARSKLVSLQKTLSPTIDDTVVAQYADYKKHLAEEIHDKSEQNAFNNVSSPMPTFAAVRVLHDAEGFKRTPFYFISGKKLGGKAGYVKINFKSIHQYQFSAAGDENHRGGSYITFFIHHPDHNGPAIEVSSSLKRYNFQFSENWKEYVLNGTRLLTPIKDTDAYTFLIQRINEGDRSYFVDIDGLLEAWRIWDPIQSAIRAWKMPLTEYDENKLNSLDFYHDYKDNRMKLMENHEGGIEGEGRKYTPDFPFEFSIVQNETFRGSKLVTGGLDHVMKQLALSLLEGINDAEKRGEVLHVAFPGGRSILPVFKNLCLMKNLFKKHHLHIWIVDERCVSLNSTHSNFHNLIGNLQDCLGMPHQNLHPMPVGSGMLKCKKESVIQYAEEIKTWMPSMQFDVIVLGIGADGHVASLFPGDHRSKQSLDWIIVNHSGPKQSITARISMTFRLINSAKKVILIATGQTKRRVVDDLKSQDKNEEYEDGHLPAMNVKPANGTVVWFIDDVAFN